MADVFVSYARSTETPFVDRLQAALGTRGFDCWVDREDILPSSPWRAEIDQAILESHIFLFVVSPTSVASPYCLAELARAVELGKRLVPVVAVPVTDAALPAELAEIQYSDFSGIGEQDDEAFASRADALAGVLDTDIESLHVHTRLLTHAERWAQRGHDRSLLLRGRELVEAEKWLDAQTTSGRPVLPQQQRLVRESRQAAIRRQRGSMTAALAIALAMAVLAVLTAVEWRVAVHQKHEAEVQRDRSDSLYLAQESQSQLPVDPQLALLLGLRAYGYTPTAQAQQAVRDAVAQSSLEGVVPGASPSTPWPFSPDGRWVVSTSYRDDQLGGVTVAPGAAVRPGAKQGPTVTLRIPHAYVYTAEFNASGTAVLAVVHYLVSGVYQVISWDWRSPGSRPRALARLAVGDNNLGAALDRQGTRAATVLPTGHIALVGTATGRTLRTFAPRDLGAIAGLAFSPDGKFLAAVGARATQVWSVDGATARGFRQGGSGALAFSPDDSRLAVGVEGTDGTQVDVVTLATGAIASHDMPLPSALSAHCCDVNLVSSLAWSPDGTTLAATTEDPVVWLWAGAATSPVYLQSPSEGSGGDLAFTPDGRSLLDGDLLWSWRATIYSYLSGDYVDVAFRPGTSWVAGSNQSGGIALWDWQTFASSWLVPPRATTAPAATVGPYYSDLVFSPDGRYLAADEGDLVTVWDMADDAPVGQLKLPNVSGPGDAEGLEFSPDGTVLAVVATASVGPRAHDVLLYWPWRAGRAAALQLKGSEGYLAGFKGRSVRVLTTPADGSGGSRLVLWGGRAGTSATVEEAIPARDGWDEAYVLPGGDLLLADQAGVALYDPRSTRLRPVVRAYEATFVMSPAGDAAALTGSTGYVDVWDLDIAHAPVVAFKSQAEFPTVAWGGDGTRLGVADKVDGLRVMSALPYLPMDRVLPYARTLAVTSLTSAERKQFLP